MTPVRTNKDDGVYKAPKGMEALVGDLPYYRENGIVYSIWELENWELDFLYNHGGRILVGQMGEPIHPISLGVIGRGQTKEN